MALAVALCLNLLAVPVNGETSYYNPQLYWSSLLIVSTSLPAQSASPGSINRFSDVRYFCPAIVPQLSFCRGTTTTQYAANKSFLSSVNSNPDPAVAFIDMMYRCISSISTTADFYQSEVLVPFHQRLESSYKQQTAKVQKTCERVEF